MRGLCADIEITRRCDLQCSVCFVHAQPEPAAELSTAQVLAVLDELPTRHCLVHLTGGEPFVHPGIWAILGRAAERGFPEVVINTHGQRLDDAALDRLASLPISIRLLVSLDGPAGTHDRSRGEGATSRAVAAIVGARRRGITAEPASILTCELVDAGLERWHGWLADRLDGDVSLVLYPLCLGPDRAALPGDVGTPLAPEDLAHGVADPVASMIRAGRRVAVVDMPLINPLLARRGVPGRLLHGCEAGRGRFGVQADGWVTPCHPCRHPLVPLGPNLLRRLLRHPDYRRIGRRRFEDCATCAERPICGHCRAQVLGRGAPLFGTDGWCERVLEEVRDE